MLRKQLWQTTAPALALLWRRFPVRLQALIMRCFAPSFLVGVSVICIDEQGLALLLDHRFSKPAERWGLPGGVLGHAEDPMEGARRELLEETGMQADGLVPLRVSADGTYLNIVYLCYVTRTAIRLQTTELLDWQWCDPETVDLPMREHHRRALRLVARQPRS